jgi:hypothetical protein
MTSELMSLPGQRPPVVPWPPDDTEESVAGTSLHQTTITNIRLGINEIAALLTPPGGDLPWQALSQTMLMGLARRDGSEYHVFPDIFVYRQRIGRLRGSVSLQVDGPALLVVEVLSESTYANDLDLGSGKGYAYERAGVREYRTLDPTGEYVPELGRGWRLVEGAYRPWRPDEHGRWRSETIDVAFVVEGVLATVYSLSGRRMLREGEIEAELARKDEELAELRRKLERLERGGAG